MTRNKKILLGVGVVVVLAGIAYANFRFKRVDGVTVNTEAIKKRDLKAIVSASGKIQPKRFVNISADTSGRVTDLAVNEGDRVKQGQFLLQIDPRNLRTRVQSGEASLGAARSQLEQMRLSLESARTALKQAEDAYRRQQNLAKGGLTTQETLERAENDLNDAQGRPAPRRSRTSARCSCARSRSRRRSRTPGRTSARSASSRRSTASSPAGTSSRARRRWSAR